MVRLGMFLIRVVVWSSEQLWRSSEGRGIYLRAGAARLALAGVSIIGAVVDWASGMGASRADNPVRRGPDDQRIRYRASQKSSA